MIKSIYDSFKETYQKISPLVETGHPKGFYRMFLNDDNVYSMYKWFQNIDYYNEYQEYIFSDKELSINDISNFLINNIENLSKDEVAFIKNLDKFSLHSLLVGSNIDTYGIDIESKIDYLSIPILFNYIYYNYKYKDRSSYRNQIYTSNYITDLIVSIIPPTNNVLDISDDEIESAKNILNEKIQNSFTNDMKNIFDKYNSFSFLPDSVRNMIDSYKESLRFLNHKNDGQ